jgi:hypothetical protein
VTRDHSPVGGADQFDSLILPFMGTGGCAERPPWRHRVQVKADTPLLPLVLGVYLTCWWMNQKSPCQVTKPKAHLSGSAGSWEAGHAGANFTQRTRPRAAPWVWIMRHWAAMEANRWFAAVPRIRVCRDWYASLVQLVHLSATGCGLSRVSP